MKKNLFLALALAAPVMAGVDAPVVEAPAPAPAPVISPWSMEIGGVYRCAAEDIVDGGDEIDLWGGDITAIYKLDDHHSVNLRFGYNYGDVTESGSYGPQEDWYNKTEVRNFYIMPGYRYTDSICDCASWYVGANIGASNMKVKVSGIDNDILEHYSDSDKDWGFAASAELGLQYHISDAVYLYGAYQYWMSTAEVGDGEIKTEKQHYHSVTAGIGINF